MVNCTNCGATGLQPCTDCQQGKIRKSCDRCSGTGRNDHCSVCKSTGKFFCRACNGSGIAAT
jgi:hypothetical protein